MALVAAAAQVPPTAPQGELRRGRELLMAKQFAGARDLFAGYLRTHPEAVEARLGVGDAELGMHEYEQAEATYRALTAEQPQLWQAHKNLVVVEAALGRWDDFDRERTVLRMARERGAPGLSARESDVIDSFTTAGGQRWVVRAYFVPVGRSEARYNFECFSAAGRVLAYLSLENAAAAREALRPDDVRIGAANAPVPDRNKPALALNWYTGNAHGTVRSYPTGEPPYRQLRAEALRWIRAHPKGGKESRQGTP